MPDGQTQARDLPQTLLPAGHAEATEQAPAAGAEPEPTLRSEFGHLLKLGLPLALSQGAKMVQDVSNGIILGRFDTLALAAVSVSGIWTSLTDIMFYSGLSQLATLCSEADGAGNKGLVGTWLQIFLVFTTIGAVPVCALRWCTSPILQLLGLQHDLARIAGEYAIWSQFGFVFDMWYFAVKEYYAAQMIVYPDAVVDFVFIFVNIAVVSFFVDGLGLGVRGAAIATTSTRVFRLFVYVLYCWYKGFHKQTWKGWSCKEISVRSRWCRLLGLVIPAAVGGLAEEVQFEVCSVLAGRMGSVDSAAWSLDLNIVIIFFLVGMALGDAVGIRMARFLGEGRISEAVFVTRVGVASTTFLSVLMALCLYLVMGAFARMASTDERVRDLLMQMRWVTSLCIALLGAFFPLASILTKSGRSWVLGTVVPVCCWLLGFPVTYLLSKKHGLVGIFEGLCFGYFWAAAACLLAYLRSDWATLAEQARERAEVAPERSDDQLSLSPMEGGCEGSTCSAA